MRYARDQAPVLKDINVTVKGGEKIGIVGKFFFLLIFYEGISYILWNLTGIYIHMYVLLQ